MDYLELVLVSREQQKNGAQTADYRLEIKLGDALPATRSVTELSPSDWPGSRHSTPDDYKPKDLSYRSHSLSGFSAFGTGERNEFATWVQGRETFLSSPILRDACEEDVRMFAERSDHTEGFMLTTPTSDGFGGLASIFLESLRDDFPKHPLFTTAMLTDATGWKREDNERSISQRLLNNALSMQSLEELSSMVLPIQPSCSWDDKAPWTRFLRDDVGLFLYGGETYAKLPNDQLPKRETYSQVLTMHLQSTNSELREIDGLTTIVEQLNWRGDNKIAHLQGATPLLPPDHLQGAQGMQTFKDSIKDFSVQPDLPPRKASARAEDITITQPFAQYAIVRGYADDELERLGSILERSTPLIEPLSMWVALPEPFPIVPAARPIFRGLIPSGRPLVLAPPSNPDPLSASGLFGLPDPLFPTASTYYVQPTSVPLLTTLSTSPATRHLLAHLHAGVKELLRVRSPFLFAYEAGEYGLGRDGVLECRERLETLADNYGGAHGAREDDSEEDGLDEDEDFED